MWLQKTNELSELMKSITEANMANVNFQLLSEDGLLNLLLLC